MLLGGHGDELHHDQGANGDDFVIGVAFCNQSVQSVGDQTLFTIGAVVGHELQLAGAGTELVFQDHDVLGTEADDRVNLAAFGVQLLSHGQSDGAANAAANNGDLLLTGSLGCVAQGANEVLQVVALFLGVQLDGSSADNLENDGDSALLTVKTGDGQRDALAILIHTQDDELTGLSLLGDQGSLDLQQGDGGVQGLFRYDAIHKTYQSFLNSNVFLLY